MRKGGRGKGEEGTGNGKEGEREWGKVIGR